MTDFSDFEQALNAPPITLTFSPEPEAIEDTFPEHDGDVNDFLDSFQKPDLPSVTDPEKLVEQILLIVPEADPDYVEDLVRQASDEFIEVLLSKMGKSARFVRDKILQQGYVTTGQVRAQYDPVAIFDLTRLGIPLKSDRFQENGRTSMRYTFDPIAFTRRQERRDFLTLEQRKQLCEMYDNRCAICQTPGDHRTLQMDHRTPFVLVGNTLVRSKGWQEELRPTCPSCNSLRKDICADCPNMGSKNVEGSLGCHTCRWAYPKNATHSAGEQSYSVMLTGSTQEDIQFLAELKSRIREHGINRILAWLRDRCGVLEMV